MVYWGCSISHELGKLRQEEKKITNNMCIDEQVPAMDKGAQSYREPPLRRLYDMPLKCPIRTQGRWAFIYPFLSPMGANSPTFPSQPI